MLTRVARNDVVRSVHTGEVGTVDGWADHAKINGTIVDVRFSSTDVRPCGVANLEFVADAKPQMSAIRSMFVLTLLTADLAYAVITALMLHRSYSMDWVGSIAFGVAAAFTAWATLYRVVLRPRKTRMTQPARVVVAKGTRGVGQPPRNSAEAKRGPAGQHTR